MSTPQEKAQCVSWFIETKLDIRLKFCCANFPSLQNRSNKNISKNKIFTNLKNCNDNTGQQKKIFVMVPKMFQLFLPNLRALIPELLSLFLHQI